MAAVTVLISVLSIIVSFFCSLKKSRYWLISGNILVTYVGVDKVGTERSTALKLSVGDSNTSVHDVGSDASAGSVVEDVVRATNISVRETDEARSGVSLSNEGVLGLDNGIGLDVGDLLSR